MKLRQKRMLRGMLSSPWSIVMPVVVKPLTVSK